MFDGFSQDVIRVGGVRIYARCRPNTQRRALLLLHGYPQTHFIWHRVTPLLAERYAIVVADLRGYGASDKPTGSADHSNYSKRAMAADMAAVMRHYGYDNFGVVGHDRGGRVAHRLAVDHPDAVQKLMLLDIAPTLAMYEQTSMDFAQSYWWWFFLIQPSPFPETLIAGNPEVYLKKKIGYGSAGLAPFSPEAYAAYLQGVSDPATVHGMCEDYRAAASIDLEHDRADRDAGRKLQCPVRALWGEQGVVNRCFKPLAEWRRVTDEHYPVTGYALKGGHYIPEELPAVLASEINSFFGD
jgi:haloacetate dehalogenase